MPATRLAIDRCMFKGHFKPNPAIFGRRRPFAQPRIQEYIPGIQIGWQECGLRSVRVDTKNTSSYGDSENF